MFFFKCYAHTENHTVLTPPFLPLRPSDYNVAAERTEHPLLITSEKPMIAFSGVRSSWLMLARNADFARLAASAASRAERNSCSRCSREVMSVKVATEPPHGSGCVLDRKSVV